MVEIDELEKRLAWLDSERQKDKKEIKELRELLETYQQVTQKQGTDVKKLAASIKTNSAIPLRIEQIIEENSASKAELLKKMVELEKSISAGDKKNEQSHKGDIDGINKRINELHSELKPINEIKKTVSERIEEEFRIGQKMETIASQLPELQLADEDLRRQLALVLGERSQETKRTTDVQLETAALKKRIEEIRNTIELDKEATRKLDKKLDEVSATEKERKQTQTAFLEKVSLSQVEMAAQRKEWQDRYVELQEIEQTIKSKMLELNEAQRSIKKTQAEFEEINERFNRRINEITEMNRLSEERFRQEWVAFKADDQKRWTNYTLASDEESREDARTLNKVNERLVKIEDMLQEMQDTSNLLIEETKNHLDGFYNATREMVENFNQAFRKRM